MFQILESEHDSDELPEDHLQRLMDQIELRPGEAPAARNHLQANVVRRPSSVPVSRSSLDVEAPIVASVSNVSLNRIYRQQMLNTELLDAIGNDEKVARLRSGHYPSAMFAYLMRKADLPNCLTCGKVEDVQYLLMDCIRNEVERDAILKTLYASNRCRTYTELLQDGANPNASCGYCFVTACHVAALKGGEALSLLIDKGAEPFREDKFGRNPIHFAAFAGNDIQLQILLNILNDNQNNVGIHQCSPMNARCCLKEVTVEIAKAWTDNDTHYCENTRMPLFQPGWTPLHVASACAKVSSASVLLNFRADPNITDASGRTALDVAGYAFYHNHEIKENDLINVINMLKENGGLFNTMRPSPAVLDNIDTPLHTAVEIESLEALKVLLDADASASCLNKKGQTPSHLCVNKKLEKHLKIISRRYVDVKNESGRTVLQAAIDAGWISGVNIVLQAGAAITSRDNYNNTSIHSAARLGNVKVLRELLDFVSQKDAIDYRNNEGLTALFKATFHGHADCVKELIKRDASLTIMLPGDVNLLNVAARHGRLEVLKILLENNVARTFINRTTAKVRGGRAPLHDAILCNHVECVKLLLREGADLSKLTNVGKSETKTAIAMLFDTITDPKEFLEDVFDSYITTNGQKHNGDCNMALDYRVLIPINNKMDQMRVLVALINTGNRYDQHKLLAHPLVESFICRKWKALSFFFNIAITFHVLNLLFLTLFVMSSQFYEIFSIKILRIVAFVFLLLKISQETIVSTNNFLHFEGFLKISSVLLSNFIFVPDSILGKEASRDIATAAILLSWIDMLYLLSRVPCLGKYVLMFEKITFDVVKTLLMFLFLIIGFTLSFAIQFRQEEPFENPWAALTKVMVMMTSEFDYKDMFYGDEENESPVASSIVTRIIFLLFLVVAAIVLMNLLVGIAVNDIDDLKKTGTIKRLIRQVGFITEIDSLLYSKVFKILNLRGINDKLRRIRTVQRDYEFCVVTHNPSGLCPCFTSKNNLPANLVHNIVNRTKQVQKISNEEKLRSEVFNLNVKMDLILKELRDRKCYISASNLSRICTNEGLSTN